MILIITILLNLRAKVQQKVKSEERKVKNLLPRDKK